MNNVILQTKIDYVIIFFFEKLTLFESLLYKVQLQIRIQINRPIPMPHFCAKPKWKFYKTVTAGVKSIGKNKEKNQGVTESWIFSGTLFSILTIVISLNFPFFSQNFLPLFCFTIPLVKVILI